MHPPVVIVFANGVRLRVLPTRTKPHCADLELYFRAYAKGLTSLNANYAFQTLPPPGLELLRQLVKHVATMQIRRQVRFIRAFRHLIHGYDELDEAVLDLETLPKEAQWSMLYHCLPRESRKALDEFFNPS